MARRGYSVGTLRRRLYGEATVAIRRVIAEATVAIRRGNAGGTVGWRQKPSGEENPLLIQRQRFLESSSVDVLHVPCGSCRQQGRR